MICCSVALKYTTIEGPIYPRYRSKIKRARLKVAKRSVANQGKCETAKIKIKLKKAQTH